MEEKKQKHFYNFKCPTCGHEWKSYGFGKRVICPNCYEKRTGKKLGQSAERMAELRAMRNKKPKEAPAAVSEDTVTVAETEQPEKEAGTWTSGGGNDDSIPQPEPKPNITIKPAPEPKPTATQEKPEPRQPNALEKFLGFRIS